VASGHQTNDMGSAASDAAWQAATKQSSERSKRRTSRSKTRSEQGKSSYKVITDNEIKMTCF
jgi:hypothetical protein